VLFSVKQKLVAKHAFKPGEFSAAKVAGVLADLAKILP
jgi:hypothetical protein